MSRPSLCCNCLTSTGLPAACKRCDLAGEILQEIAGQAELGEDDQACAPGPRLADHLRMPLQVGLEISEAGGDLGEGDADGLHARSLAAAPSRTSNPKRPRRVLTFEGDDAPSPVLGWRAPGWPEERAGCRLRV